MNEEQGLRRCQCWHLQICEAEDLVELLLGDEDDLQVLELLMKEIELQLKLSLVLLDELVAIVKYQEYLGVVEGRCLSLFSALIHLGLPLARGADAARGFDVLVQYLVDLLEGLHFLEVALVDATTEHVSVVEVADELGDEAGLADALVAVHVDHLLVENDAAEISRRRRLVDLATTRAGVLEDGLKESDEEARVLNDVAGLILVHLGIGRRPQLRDVEDLSRKELRLVRVEELVVEAEVLLLEHCLEEVICTVAVVLGRLLRLKDCLADRIVLRNEQIELECKLHEEVVRFHHKHLAQEVVLVNVLCPRVDLDETSIL